MLKTIPRNVSQAACLVGILFVLLGCAGGSGDASRGGGGGDNGQNTPGGQSASNISPVVTNITSTSPDGYYVRGQTIPILVTFSQPVYVTGTPKITLDIYPSDREVNYASGSGTDTLTFDYKIGYSDEATDLDYAASDALYLDEGTINNSAGIAANLSLPTPKSPGSLGANKNLKVDAKVPPSPFSLTATASDGKVTLNWQSGGGSFSGYMILRKVGSAVSAPPINGTSYNTADILPVENEVVYLGTANSYLDTQVTNGLTYHYSLFAYDLAKNYSVASAASATPTDLPGPFVIRYAAIKLGSVTLYWDEASNNPTNYTVKYGTSSGNHSVTASTNATVPFTVAGLTAGTTYYFMVSATNSKGTTNAVEKAVKVPEAMIVSDQADSNHTCYLFSNGKLKCWGSNQSGGLGTGNMNSLGDGPNEMGASLPEIQLGTGKSAVQVAVGEKHTCALLNDGNVKCWGENTNGQLGLGHANDMGDGPNEMGNNLPAVDLGTGRTALQIFAGQKNTCALLDNKGLKCWGSNTYGQLGKGAGIYDTGNNLNEMGDSLTNIDLGTGRFAVNIATSGDHVCALLDNGAVKCWGSNTSGQLGQRQRFDWGDDDGEMGDALPATDLGSGITVAELAAGTSNTCALFTNGKVKCWGYGGSGANGSGSSFTIGNNSSNFDMGDSLAFVNLGTGRTATQLSMGQSRVCAILDNSSVKCWGYGLYGALGQGNTVTIGDRYNHMGDNLLPVNLGTGRTAKNITGGRNHVCTILDNNSIKCWGRNDFGQLGQGDINHRGDGAGEMGDSLAVTGVQ